MSNNKSNTDGNSSSSSSKLSEIVVSKETKSEASIVLQNEFSSMLTGIRKIILENPGFSKIMSSEAICKSSDMTFRNHLDVTPANLVNLGTPTEETQTRYFKINEGTSTETRWNLYYSYRKFQLPQTPSTDYFSVGLFQCEPENSTESDHLISLYVQSPRKTNPFPKGLNNYLPNLCSILTSYQGKCLKILTLEGYTLDTPSLDLIQTLKVTELNLTNIYSEAKFFKLDFDSMQFLRKICIVTNQALKRISLSPPSTIEEVKVHFSSIFTATKSLLLFEDCTVLQRLEVTTDKPQKNLNVTYEKKMFTQLPNNSRIKFLKWTLPASISPIEVPSPSWFSELKEICFIDEGPNFVYRSTDGDHRFKLKNYLQEKKHEANFPVWTPTNDGNGSFV